MDDEDAHKEMNSQLLGMCEVGQEAIDILDPTGVPFDEECALFLEVSLEAGDLECFVVVFEVVGVVVHSLVAIDYCV